MVIHFFLYIVSAQNLLVPALLPKVHFFEYLFPIYYPLEIYVDRLEVGLKLKT